MAKVVHSNAIGILRIFAWFETAGAIVGAVLLPSVFPRPYGLAVGIAVLAQGIFFSAFFYIIAAIADNITSVAEDIQDFKKLYLYKGMTQEEVEHAESQRFKSREDYEAWKAKRLPKSDKT